jgi:hypothetical protein
MPAPDSWASISHPEGGKVSTVSYDPKGYVDTASSEKRRNM